jgi:hypothetical protein
MGAAKKTRAQQRYQWEREIWEALVEYANTGEKFKNLVGLSLDWINGDIDDLELCQDIKGGTSLETLANRYRKGIHEVLSWLSAPTTSPDAAKACWFLMNHGNLVHMAWTKAFYKPNDLDSMLIQEWPKKLGTVVAPVCKFIKEQIDRHDLGGEPLRDVIPIGICDRPGCGKFRVVKHIRPGRFFCSNLCKAMFHQSSKTPEERASYMKKYRRDLDRNKPKGGRLIVRRRPKK